MNCFYRITYCNDISWPWHVRLLDSSPQNLLSFPQNVYELDPVDYKYEHPVWGPLEEGLAGPRLSMLIISWSHGQLLLDALRKLYYWVDAHVASFLGSLHGCSLSFCLSSLPFVLLVLFFFQATPRAYRSFQARDSIQATAVVTPDPNPLH